MAKSSRTVISGVDRASWGDAIRPPDGEISDPGPPLQEPVYEPIYNPAVEEGDVVYQPF